jgi:outer membrane immunogenic protein
MKIRSLAAAALVTIAAFSSANAADLPMPATVYKAPPPPAPTWTGCYVGGGGGYGMWNQDSSVHVAGLPPTAQTTNGGKGWFGQGQLGCDYQFTSPIFNVPLVVGAFGDYDGGSISGVSDFPGFVGTERQSAAWSVGGRIGTLIAPRVLTYFDGGWTQARFDSVNYNIAIAGRALTRSTTTSPLPAADRPAWVWRRKTTTAGSSVAVSNMRSTGCRSQVCS